MAEQHGLLAIAGQPVPPTALGRELATPLQVHHRHLYTPRLHPQPLSQPRHVSQPCPAVPSQPATRCSQPHQPLFWRDCARQARAPADWVAIEIQSDAHDLHFKCGGTLTDTFWLVGEFCTRVGGGVWTVREGIEFGTKAMTAHENTADHTSSAANGPFIAYLLGLVLLAGCMLKMLVGKYVHRYM
jgi:hypothetical protein